MYKNSPACAGKRLTNATEPGRYSDAKSESVEVAHKSDNRQHWRSLTF
jgi:hypothetical protein